MYHDLRTDFYVFEGFTSWRVDFSEILASVQLCYSDSGVVERRKKKKYETPFDFCEILVMKDGDPSVIWNGEPLVGVAAMAVLGLRLWHEGEGEEERRGNGF